MMQLKDPIVVFTDRPSFFTKWRTDKLLYVVETTLPDTNGQWEEQHRIDPEKHLHHDTRLYKVWGLKTTFVRRALALNPFRSKYFVWSDAGAYRDEGFHDRLNFRLANVVIHPTKPTFINISPYTVEDKDYTLCDGSVGCRRIAAAQFGCSAGACILLDIEYKRMQRYLHARGKFIGNDQNVFAHICRQPSRCHLLRPVKNGNPWVSLKYHAKFGSNPFVNQNRRTELTVYFNGTDYEQRIQLEYAERYATQIGLELCLHAKFRPKEIVFDKSWVKRPPFCVGEDFVITKTPLLYQTNVLMF